MASKLISKDANGNPELTLTVGKGYIPVCIYYYGKLIGEINSKTDLSTGKEFLFGAGETLFIRFNSEQSAFEFRRNGEYLKSSGFNPVQYFTYPVIFLQVYVGVNLVILIPTLINARFNAVYQWYYELTLLYIIVLGILSFMVKKANIVALSITLVLLGFWFFYQSALFLLPLILNNDWLPAFFLAIAVSPKLILARGIWKASSKYRNHFKSTEPDLLI